jgi:hypothetical protein
MTREKDTCQRNTYLRNESRRNAGFAGCPGLAALLGHRQEGLYMLDWLAGAAVLIAPVSDLFSLLTGNLTGNFTKMRTRTATRDEKAL